MKKRKIIKYIFSILSILILTVPNVSLAISLNLNYPTFDIGGRTFNLNTNQDLNEIIAWFYYFIIIISGFVAFTMLVWGGFKWLTSAGNPSAIGDAKDIIKNALLGLLLILASWVILRVINPDLTTLQTPPL